MLVAMRLLCIALASLVVVGPRMVVASADDIAGPAELWRGYDPIALPLDVQLLDQWEQDGVRVRTVFFTGEVYQGVPVRVYAIYGAPVGGKRLPAVLHIHGGGQTASPDHVLFWAKRGYAAASFDHMGPMYNRTVYTHWGKVPIERQYDLNGDPRNDRFYHSTIAARRALTFLASQPEVDPSRMGIYGVSFGGSFTWLVSATDSRVRCAVPIYGCGGISEKLGTEAGRKWGALYDAFTYAPHQKCPVLLLNASNDHHGYIDHSDYVMRLTNTENRVAYTHGYIHHIEPTEATNLLLWMDTHLRGGLAWPKTPVLGVVLSADGVPEAVVRPDNPQTVTEVYVRYNIENGAEPPARFWRTSATTMLADRKWSARIPVMDPGKMIRVYCDVRYRNGIALSSLLTSVVPSSLGSVRATLKPSGIIDDFIDGAIHDWYNDASYTDPIVLAGPMVWPVVNGPDGRWGISVNAKIANGVCRLSTNKIGDPVYSGREHKALSFKVRAQSPTSLKVVLVRNAWKPDATEYVADVTLADTSTWQDISLAIDSFREKNGEQLADWSKTNQLRLEGKFASDKPLAFAGFRWSN